MSAMRNALIAAGIDPERPKPSETWECLKVRPQYVYRNQVRYFTDTTKRCARCEEWLPLDHFHVDRSHPSGRHCYCRPCRSAYDSKRYKIHRKEAA